MTENALAAGEFGGRLVGGGRIESCKALRFTHRGAYEGLMATYRRITAFLKVRGLMQSEADWA